MGHAVAILPSPLLGVTAYAALRDVFVSAGHDATVLSGIRPGESAADLASRWAVEADRSSLLVAHSNAGLLAPLVRAALTAPTFVVFMDAALPSAAGPTALAPAPFRELLGGLVADDGLLPPWTRWWPRADVMDVVPADRFDQLDASCPRLPLSYFDELITAPDGWVDDSNAYLAFADTYAEELRFARDHSWRTLRLTGGHLHFVRDPVGVAEAVMRLVDPR